MIAKPVDIASLLPHSGAMVLLERVVEWNGDSIVCTASSHRQQDNPLRRAGRLSSLCGIEYGAQAAAVHAMLSGIRHGMTAGAMLGGVNSVKTRRGRLDDIEDDLTVWAELLRAQENGAIYAFRLSTPPLPPIVEGRITVMFV